MSIDCPIPECEFKVGEEVPSDCKPAILQLHLLHHQTELNATTAAKAAKLKLPSISVGSSTEDWSYFLSRWGTYKSATKLSGTEVTVQMLECCDDALRRDLTRVHRNSISDMNETALLGAIKRLAVIEESTLVSRYKLHNLRQDIDEPIRSYAARIRGQAHICKLYVPCPQCHFLEVDFSDQIIKDVITKGIIDEDIRLTLLGEKNQDMSLEETISYIEAKECGKKSACRLLDNTSTTAATSRYKKSRKQSYLRKKCNYCGETGHNSEYKERQEKCAAFKHVCEICHITGHLEFVCRRRNAAKDAKANRNGVEESNLISENAIFDTLCASKYDCVCASNINSNLSCVCASNVNSNSSCSTILDHHVYNDIQRFWELKPSDPQPTIKVSVAVSKSSYADFTFSQPPHSNTATISVIADTGCQSCLAGLNILGLLGLKLHQLIKCSMKMSSANNKVIQIHGALPIEITGLVPSGLAPKTKQIVYFTSQTDKFYINKRACIQLGLVPDNFPSITTTDKNTIDGLQSVNALSALTSACNCPISPI